MAIGLLNNYFFKVNLALVYGQPLRVYQGTAIKIPTPEIFEGNVKRLAINNTNHHLKRLLV